MNDNDLDLDLTPKLPKKLPSSTNIILIILVIIAALISLGEFKLTLTGIVNVSVMVIALYIIASIIYKSTYIDSLAKEKEGSEYLAAKQAFDEACKKIYDKGLLTKLPEMCITYSREELKNTRTSLLIDACIPYELYDTEYRGKTAEQLRAMELPEDTVRCILIANKAKAMRLTPTALLSSGEDQPIAERILKQFGIRRGIGMESKTRQQIDMSANMISRAVTTLLVGAVGVSVVIDEFSLETIASWALKMLPIATAAMSGASGGKHNVHDTLIPQLERKTKIINTMIATEEHSPITTAAPSTNTP